MPLNCDKCEQTIRNGLIVKCKGVCYKEFCAKCAGLSDYDIKSVLIKPNILYMCDNCMDYKETVLERFQKVLNEVTEGKNRLAQQENEIKRILNELNNIAKNEDRLMKELKKSSNHKETYAEKLRGEPPLIIKPKVKQNPMKTKEDLRKKVDPTGLKITGMSAKQSGVIAIDSGSREEMLKLKQLVGENLGDSYEVKVPLLRNPRLFVSGICNKWEKEEIIRKIKCQNDHLKESYMKCVKLIEKQKNKYVYYNAIIEIDNSGYNKALEAKKINIGWDSCRVYDGITVRRCFKCLGYNHISTECRNEEACAKCNGKHDTRKCTNENEIQKCINCERSNQNLRLNLKTDHSVWSKECPVYLNKIKIEKKKLGF